MVSQAIIDRTKRHEGLKLSASPDAKGKCSIGYGHDLSEFAAAHTGPITMTQAETLLQEDLEQAEYAVDKQFAAWIDCLSDVRQEVLVEMVFQLGMGGLMGFHKMLMSLSAGDYAGAAAQMIMSEWHAETPARCEELADIISTGVDNGGN